METSIQLQRSKKFSEHCIHTKSISTILDTPTHFDSYKKTMKHIGTCRFCNDQLKQYRLMNEAAKVFIPKALMDKDLKLSFERELDDLFKVMNLNKRTLLKKNVKKGFHALDQMGIALINTMSSRKMIKTYAVAAGLFFILKKIF